MGLKGLNAVGTNAGDKRVMELTEGGGAGERDASKCYVLEVTDSSGKNKPFPWLLETARESVRVWHVTSRSVRTVCDFIGIVGEYGDGWQ